MGTWGTGPYQSDTAGQWLSETLRPAIEKALKKGDEEEARVAAAAITDYLGKHESVEDLATLAIERLEDILDDDWSDLFRDPDAAVRAVEDQIRALRKTVRDQKEPQRPVSTRRKRPRRR
jgi:hypothetical protein